MSSATQLGISEREYEEALAVEKLFFLSSKERCTYCSAGKPTFVDTYNYEFVCDRCSFRSKHKKRIGEDSISYYDVQKLEKKFGVASSSYHNSSNKHRRKSGSGHHHHHHHHHNNEKKSKSKSRHSSGKKHIEVLSDDNSSSYDYDDKIRKEKKKKKDKEKDRSGGDRDRDRRKDKHNKDKYKKKKKYDESYDDFDDEFCLNDYDHTTPGMIGIMNSNNMNSSDYKNNNMDNGFQDFDGTLMPYNQIGDGNFNDLGAPNGMNQGGVGHGNHPFDSPHFAKDHYNSKYINSPNTDMVNAANNPLCLDDYNPHHYNNKMGYSNNYNMKMSEEGELGKMKYGAGGQGNSRTGGNHPGNNTRNSSNKMNMHLYDPFDTNINNTGVDKSRYSNGAVDNVNYFKGSNFPNNQQGNMNNRLFLMNKRNSLNHNYNQQNSNANSMYSHFANTQNPYMMNNQNMINAKMLYDNNMNSSKNKNFHNSNPNSPFMLNGGTISNANNANGAKGAHTNNMNNAMGYCNQGNLNDRTKWHDNGSSNNAINGAINSASGGGNHSSNNTGGSHNDDFSAVIVSDKNPFSLQNIISNNKNSPNYMNTMTEQMNPYMYK
ncbi:hypothetical protein AK88_04880 [Plasmodium fragile]|uniref:Uncharacterized protein n=1 Tax=Plasmodium fragile TaxID=5857 RepID=A0A0D9QER6_PLAFR|nr:uncharacterized protein AK88_04880 [Plasmodium fragile]KJP85484.1 hypothetical protein AK88_04880 [Plasmodium fragile]